MGSDVMSEGTEAGPDPVNPVRRDKLARLGDKLDIAERADDDAWITLFFEYERLAIASALATKQPKIKIKTMADMWAADALWDTLWKREKAIKADSAANSAKDSRRMRTAADLAALLALTERDRLIVAAAIRQYQDKKRSNKEAWRRARRLVRIPERDRLPQR
jgi:hypothetical protein